MAHIHKVQDTDIHFKIDGTTRTVKNVQETKIMLVQRDHNSERFTFEIPRMVDNHDMSTCNVVQIHYINIDSINKNNQSLGVYEVDDLAVSPDNEDVVTCSWLISENATRYVGKLSFAIRFVCSTDGTVDYAWNTATYSGVNVTSGIYNGEEIAAEYADILEQWREELLTQELPTTLPNPYALKIRYEGKSTVTFYDGASSESITIPETLPNPKPLVINGVAYDGSQRVEIGNNNGASGASGSYIVMLEEDNGNYRIAGALEDMLTPTTYAYDTLTRKIASGANVACSLEDSLFNIQSMSTDGEAVQFGLTTVADGMVGSILIVIYSDDTVEVVNNTIEVGVDESAVISIIDAKENSVKAYGAKGDGVADDTEWFQKALAQNRIVTVPGGTYKLSGELVIGANCCLELSQDTVLDFTQTTGNCISFGMLGNLKGNHATVRVPYGFSGVVINASTAIVKDQNEIYAVPPYSKWDPQWKYACYLTDLNIVKPDSRGFHYSVNGDCNGTAVSVIADGYATSTYMWGTHFSGLRIAGAFQYGIRAQTLVKTWVDGNGKTQTSGWNHEMRVDAFIDACETGVSLEGCNNAYISAIIQPRRAYTLEEKYLPYAKYGIKLTNSKNVDLSGSRVWDWDSEKTLCGTNAEYQHIAMYGQCRGLILNDFCYYEVSDDIRDTIFTDTPSNLEQMTILQEPITRWFKPKDGVPYFSDGLKEKRIITEEELADHFDTEIVKGFTDVLATAIDTDGAVYNGVGYKIGARVPTTGGTPEVNAWYGCTGFIPCAQGKQIFADGLSYASGDDYCQIILFDSNFNYIVHVNRGNLLKGNNYHVGYKETANGFVLTVNSVPELNNVAYARLNIHKSQWGENPMIAIDEEIKYKYEGFLADGILVKAENVMNMAETVNALIDTKLGVIENGTY